MIGYFTKGEYIGTPRSEWRFGMGDKTIRTGLCKGGRDLLCRILRLLETGRLDPAPLTSHEFEFGDLNRAFRMMKARASGIIKSLIKIVIELFGQTPGVLFIADRYFYDEIIQQKFATTLPQRQLHHPEQVPHKWNRRHTALRCV